MGILAACGGADNAASDVQAPTAAPDTQNAPLAAAPQPEPSATPQPVPTQEAAIASVNGEAIPLSEYQRRVELHQVELVAQGLDPNTADGQARLEQIRQEVLDGMIDTVLVKQESRRKGIAVSDETVSAELQAIINDSGGNDAFVSYLASSGLSEEEFRNGLYEAMLTSLIRDEVIANVSAVVPQTHARHILVDTAELADSLLSQLDAGADFNLFAQQYSQDLLTRDSGGDLDWFPRGGLILKEVEDAAFALEPGQYSGVVESAFGFHIIQVIARENARALSDDQLLAFQQVTYQEWIDSLRATANIVTQP